MVQLTKENAYRVSTLRNILNPEWGIQKFNYRDQPLNDGSYVSSVGSGCNSSCLFEDEFYLWEVASWRE